ncbi:EAL domain-containing protein (putative c-di-GMP-specific phosphodiesterase class I)/cellobiose-specific phosphotransferase system component IIC [Duganella sp. 1411]|uniref:EAL domain-containing protein n=1 Tax=Duganella sp. 1411 TaxID=2806572 RepID=UPI001AE176AA|nr:EAL domain-containing protein [Duganella sp. 1411]MBP1203369.1 EAL domain-containing protein (putative c-di-GMP-specific phosphodiesterase class I)/cellobiose-specific phosphotransferase system component IIC [Duganella sp. 1411]
MTALLKKPWSRATLWVLAIRDSFVVLLPITFLGVMAIVLWTLPFPQARRLLVDVFGPGWQSSAHDMVVVIDSLFGLALCVVLSLRVARRLATDQGDDMLPLVWVGLAALVNFMLCVMASGSPVIRPLGRDASVLLGLIIGLATPELLRLLAPRFRIEPDYDSNPTFYFALGMIPPCAILGFAVLLSAEAFMALPPLDTHRLAALAGAISTRADADWLLGIGAVLVSHVVWLAGIHGNTVLGDHALALLGGTGGVPWKRLIDVFGLLGGSGATLGLVVALLIVAREGPFRRLALVSVVPSFFNVSELLIFGLPIALNPVFWWPFLLAPLLLTLLGLTAVHSGFIALYDFTVPWTTPPFLSGYLLTHSWRGAAVQGLGLVVSTLIYLPFVRKAEARRARGQTEAFDAAIGAIGAGGPLYLRSMSPNSQAGLAARSLLAELKRGIGSAAITLAFQPKHDDHGAPIGVEALLRWQHKRHGPIRADVAVALAEEGGLIGRLGAWVLEEACARKAEWNRLGLPHITMAINVSPLQLSDPALPTVLAACLARHQLAPREIELEITESQAIAASEVVDRNLAAIVDMGVALAMDDFGMGHTSLLYLRRFAIHAIKLDGSLTRDVLGNPISRDIIQTIAALGRARQVEVVAEFVETVEQRDALAALGCNAFQGYLYSPPLPGAACAGYLLAERTDDRGP